jgi:cobalt/nickel transport system permease protein
LHIPDGFVSTPVNLVTAAISAGVVVTALAKARRAIADRPHIVPLLATTAAFVFAAQMLNFPIGGGTSGHFLGAVTAAALLGPWNACLVMALVLVIQGFFFADGGITALGTNLFNMGVVAGMGGFLLMRGLRGLLPAGRGFWLASAAVASWASVVLASASCAFQLAVSGTSPVSVALPAMAGVHAMIGIGEALIAVAVLTAAAVSRPDILPGWAAVSVPTPPQSVSRRRMTAFTVAGLLVALALALFVSPLASPHPDGLEKVAGDRGFGGSAAEEGDTFWSSSPFPDYSVGLPGGEAVSTGAAGIIGTLAVFGAGFVVIRISRGGRAS